MLLVCLCVSAWLDSAMASEIHPNSGHQRSGADGGRDAIIRWEKIQPRDTTEEDFDDHACGHDSVGETSDGHAHALLDRSNALFNLWHVFIIGNRSQTYLVVG